MKEVIVKSPFDMVLVEDSADDAENLVLELKRGDYEVTSARVARGEKTVEPAHALALMEPYK
jgi:hypothetical protein